MAFALIQSLFDVATEDLAGPTCCTGGLLPGIYYGASVGIVVSVRVWIQRSLPFGRPWTSGLVGTCRSTI